MLHRDKMSLLPASQWGSGLRTFAFAILVLDARNLVTFSTANWSRRLRPDFWFDGLSVEEHSTRRLAPFTNA
jgi:hypothetical protein